MRYDAAYVVTDLRRVPKSDRLPPLGIVFSGGDGFLSVVCNAHSGVTVDLNEVDGAFEEHRDTGTLIFRTELGDVQLSVLTLTKYREEIEPFMPGAYPDFKSDDELTHYFYQFIQGAE